MARLTKGVSVVVDRIRRRTHHAILWRSARAVKSARAISSQPGHLGPHAKNGVNPGSGIASSMQIDWHRRLARTETPLSGVQCSDHAADIGRAR